MKPSTDCRHKLESHFHPEVPLIWCWSFMQWVQSIDFWGYKLIPSWHSASQASFLGKKFKSLCIAATEVKSVEAHPTVRVAMFDQCQFGLVSPQGRPMQKRTKVLTNSVEIFESLNGKFCCKTHQHEQIQGSEDGIKRSQWAQVYPDAMVTTICEAVLRSVPQWFRFELHSKNDGRRKKEIY